MKKRSSKPDILSSLAVGSIAIDGVANRRQVNPDLVGTASFQTETYHGVFGKAFENLEVGTCRTPLGNDSHLLAIASVPSNGRINRAALRLHATVDQRDVLFV